MINTPQAPYFDDFDVEKNFLKILFKPKLSVQTRELEQMQSMFQNQLETIASQIFQNGSVVSGGKFSFKDRVDYVKLYNEYDSQIFNYEIYKGRSVYGLTTNISARIFNGWNQSLTDTPSLYLDYLTGGTNNEQTFQPEEVIQLVSRAYISLLSGEVQIGDILQGTDVGGGATAKVVNINNNEYEVVYTSHNTFLVGEQLVDQTSGANLVYNSGESVIYKAKIKSLADDPAPVGYGSAVYVDAGIYYIDGYFVATGNQSKIVSSYSTSTNVRAGFEKEVEIITSDMDHSLLDNANGYPNYNAPGADRLKIKLVLNYYNLYETPSDNFVEIMTINNSEVTGNSSINQQYTAILDTMARRTYDESGNYTVKPFLIDIQEFLDENDNNGIYKESYFAFGTPEEAKNACMQIFNQPSPGTYHPVGQYFYPFETHEEFLVECRKRLALGIEAGKAYVMGYEIENNTKIWLPMLKARDENTINNYSTSVLYGNYIKIDHVEGIPDIYHHELVNLCSTLPYDSGHVIGTARVYAIEYDSGTVGDLYGTYRLYLNEINMNNGSNFVTDVQTIASPTSGFKCKTPRVNNRVVFYDMDHTPLIFKIGKDKCSTIANSSYNYKRVFDHLTVTADGQSGGLISNISTDDVNSSFMVSDIANNYMLTIVNGPLAGDIINLTSGNISIDGSGRLTITGLPADAVSNSAILLATLHKRVNNIKSKTLHQNVSFAVTSPTEEIVLDHADGYQLVAVYDSEDPDTDATTSSREITDNYDFDNGQRDTFYDFARIRLKSGAIAPTGRLLIVYDYFSHSSGDYFTVDSYTGQVDYQDIPSYTSGQTTYDLRNCIDIRGRVDDNSVGTFESPNLPCILQNNTLFEYDLSYYMPRLDLIELDYRGNFNIKYGTASDNPQYPIGSINSMTLYYISMPAFTEYPEDIGRLYVENKRYTMRDIGTLDRRITAIEDYIFLSSVEIDTVNMPIFDNNGNQCLKTGFIVDSFANHNYGDTTASGYRCSIDITDNILRPDYKLNTITLVRSNTRESTIVERSGKYIIPYTVVPYITNSINTSFVIMNNNQIVNWAGNITLGYTLMNRYNQYNVSYINYGGSSFLKKLRGRIYGSASSSWIGNPTTN